jgi:peroxiredoxin
MSRHTGFIPLLLASVMIAASTGTSSTKPLERPASVANDDLKPDYAPIIERKMDFFSFTYETVAGNPFDLRDYARGKSVVIVEYLAGWCPNSNRNGHVVQRLWNKYRERGLGLVGVAEYSDAAELRIHIGRIGIDYPLVVETRKRDQRKDSSHYKYRRAVGDKRKWGTPFYVIIDSRDIESAISGGPIARRVYTVSGELEEAEADQFIRERVAERRAGYVSGTGSVVLGAERWGSPSASCGSVTTRRFCIPRNAM